MKIGFQPNDRPCENFSSKSRIIPRIPLRHERARLPESETHEKHDPVCVYLSPSSNHERVSLTRCTYFVYALLSCRPVNENGTRSDSHEGQDEIKDRRCRSRDNDPRVLTEDDRGGIVHLSSVSIKRLGSSTARKPKWLDVSPRSFLLFCFRIH